MTKDPRHAVDIPRRRFSNGRGLVVLWLCAFLVAGGIPAPSLLQAASASAASEGLEQSTAACGISAADAVRFLEQASFGPSFATDPMDPNYVNSVTHVMQDVCFEGWLQEQFNAPVLNPDNSAVPNIGTNYYNPEDPGTCDDGALAGGLCWSPQNVAATCTNSGPSSCNRDNYTAYLLQNQFFVNALSGRDQLRQRVAWALTEIDVVSQQTINLASWMTPYIQLFDRDAFSNYRQVLYDITLNPAMGEYLNMRGNTKTNVNENYAREILQLFSIGLNELADDGTVINDDSGPVPTYSQDIITAFAHVFTGWNLDQQIATGILNYRDPMIITNANNHDTSEQTLLNGVIVSGEGNAELNAAIDNVFGHHNVGPFIGKQLIQKLVTSNPSPGYVMNVTTAFNNGRYTGPGGITFGSGNRGDMQATIAAVLLDQEARTTPDPSNTTYGHLREPVLFVTNTLRALSLFHNAYGDTTDYVLGEQFLPSGAGTNIRMDQDVFRPPTVFSYYPPDNQLPGSPLLAPEFGIQSTSTSLAHINMAYDLAYHKMPLDTKNRPTGTWIDTTVFEPEAAGDATALIDDLNMRLMNGAMTPGVGLYSIVLTAVQALDPSNLTARVQEAIYLIASSSEYQVER